MRIDPSNRIVASACMLAFIACVVATAACEPSKTAAPAGNTANVNSNTAAPAAAAGNTAATNSAATQPPLGMEDTIEGRVVGLVCFKQNPKATPEQLADCSKANAAQGGRLGVLGADGTLYINPDVDVRVNNSQMSDFIGLEVTVQGQMIGDAPDLSWDGVTVKKFKMKIVRRKGPPPPGTPKNMKTTRAPSVAPAGKP